MLRTIESGCLGAVFASDLCAVAWANTFSYQR
jgi:hypothetical protein